MMPMRAAPLLLFGAVMVAAEDAHAGEPSIAARPGPVVWKDEWPRFSAWEGATTLGATAVSFVMELKVKDPSEANFNYELPLLDPGVRYLLRGRTNHVQDTFGLYSDLGFRMMAFFPYIVDSGIVALGIHHNPDVAAQMALIDLQALTLSGATQFLAARIVARQRPYVQDCNEAGKTFTRDCGGTNDWKSFFSGHAAGAWTTAGLVCVHHQHIPLYGGGPVEAWACTWAMGVALATGLFRVVADAHYPSDVLMGAGIGWFYGYLMPKFMHYTPNGLAAKTGAPVAVVPSFTPIHDGGMLSFGGRF
jgi:hypothetical protein